MPSTTGDRPGGGRASVLGRGAALLAVVAALAVAAAVVGQPADRARSLPVEAPWTALVLGADVLLGALMTAGALLALAAVWALATTSRQREFGRRAWWHTPLALAILAAVVLAASWMVRRGFLGEQLERLVRLGEQFGGAPGEVAPGAGGTGRPIDEALRQGAVLAGALLVVAAGLLVGLRRRLRGGGEGAEEAGERERAGARLSEAVDAALEDLDTEEDPRRAVLRCYAHLEAALAAAGCARRRAETAREHRHRAAARLGSAAQAAAGLVDRFERARYDVAPVGEADRRAAVAALHEVRAALEAARRPGRSGERGRPVERARPVERVPVPDRRRP